MPRPHDPPPARTFKHETLAFLAGLVEVSGAVFYDVDRELNAVGHALHRLGTDGLADYVRYFHALDPLHPRRFARSDHTLVRIEDAVARPALERSAYFREFLGPIGGHYEVELYLRDDDGLVGGISLLRGAGWRPFSANELARLSKARTYVEYTYGIERRLDTAASDVDGLTPRETQVVRLVCRGASNRAIGRALGIALPTVKTHLEHVYDKLDVRTRAQLVARLALASPRKH